MQCSEPDPDTHGNAYYCNRITGNTGNCPEMHTLSRSNRHKERTAIGGRLFKRTRKHTQFASHKTQPPSPFPHTSCVRGSDIVLVYARRNRSHPLKNTLTQNAGIQTARTTNKPKKNAPSSIILRNASASVFHPLVVRLDCL